MNALEAVGEAVRSKHRDDVVVPECKDGPSHGTSSLRLDYWVMRRSWTRMSTIGYEVKSSRSDFLRDSKWTGYLGLCNELWFIITKRDLIAPNELPPEVGLYRLAGTRLITVKKAVYREIAPPESLWMYVLMCRSRITREHVRDREERAREWHEWAKNKARWKDWGNEVSRIINKRAKEQVAETAAENERLRRDAETLRGVVEELESCGIDWRRGRYGVVDGLKCGRWDVDRVKAAHEALGALLDEHAGTP